MKRLRRTAIVLAALAVAMPLAHVLEMPNKFALDGTLWLEVQQHLYRGWGPFLGGPVEVLALLAAVVFVTVNRETQTRRWMTVAAFAYAGMIAAFFLFNWPVNDSVMQWTQASLPGDWESYRVRWEVGHGLAFLFSVGGLYATLRAHVRCALL